MSEIDIVKLNLGDIAPNFVAATQSGEEVELTKLLDSGQKVLLIFYPGDDTPGCTVQLCGVRDVYTEYTKLGVKVLGVNHADAKSHQKFIDKFTFPFDIIVDKEKTIATAYGALKKFFSHYTIKRGVFLIDTDKTITYIHWGQQDNQKIIQMVQQQ